MERKNNLKMWAYSQAAWHSPTLTTWGSFGAKLIGLAVLLPLILNHFSTAEIALWFLFSTIIGLLLVVDFGFSPTFTRVVAYAMGGANPPELGDFRSNNHNRVHIEPNWQTLAEIVGTMRVVYTRLAVITFLILSIFGTWALAHPIGAIASPYLGWAGWAVIVLMGTILVRGNCYSALLQGTNNIALVRRWEIMFNTGQTLSSVGVLLLGANIFELVFVHQTWVLLTVLRNRLLCQRLAELPREPTSVWRSHNSEIMKAVWPSVWRSGLGVLMGYGLVQLSGIIYAQLASASEVAPYLLGLRLVQVMSQFSQAPFYTKLPLLATLRSQGKFKEQVVIAQKGMRLSYWTFAIGVVFIGLCASPILELIDSNTTFVPPLLWLILSLAIYAERFGAMHLNLYSITNHIIWHVAGGITGVIFISLSIALFPVVQVYAFPTAMLFSYLSFYCWYSASHSYKAFNLKFWLFESKTMLPPLALLGMYAVVMVVRWS
jgi:hypothetical protein